MRLPHPHDRGGRPCLPTHPSPIPAALAHLAPADPLRSAEAPTLLACLATIPSLPWPPPRCWPGPGRWPRSPSGPPTPAGGAGRARRPAGRPRHLGGAGRGHLPPDPGPRGPGGAGRGAWRLAGCPRPSRSRPRSMSSAGGRGRRQDPARRPPCRRRPAGPPAGLHGPRHPHGAGPTRRRRRPRRGACLHPAAGRPGPCRGGRDRRRPAHPRRRRHLPGDRQAGPLPVHRQGQPAVAAGTLRRPCLAPRARPGPHP